jgi:predicted GNAT family N-acyltransferase
MEQADGDAYLTTVSVCEGFPAQYPASQFAFIKVNDTISVRRLYESDLEPCVALTASRLNATVASRDAIRRVLTNNPDAFWGIFRSDTLDHVPTLAGFYSFLLLSDEGHRVLRDHALNAVEPDLDLLAKAGERPAAVYIWAIVAEHLTAIAGPTISKAMEYLHKGLPIYATAGTQAGLNKLRNLGYRPVGADDDCLSGLFMLDRYPEKPKEAPPAQIDRLQRMLSRLKIIVVATPDDMAKVNAIRSIFIHQQRCPYDEEFDGNDFSCTHLLGFVDGEPAATLRIRYFADFVKFERLAVIDRFRRTLISQEIVKFGKHFCSRKGYVRGYGQAQKRLVPFWEHFGFAPLQKNQKLTYSDHEYVEMWGRIEQHDDPITMNSDPYLIVRPEGRWDEPGVLEHSSARPPTNPH